MSHKQWFFIYGTEPYLVQKKCMELTEGFSGQEIVQLKEPDLKSIITDIQAVSMFAPKKCIIAFQPSFLTTIAKKEEALLEQLPKLLEQTDYRLIIVNKKPTLDKRKKGVKACLKTATCFQFEAFKDWEQDKVVSWVQAEFKALGKHVSRETAQHFVDINGTNLTALYQEILKVKTYLGNDNDTLTEHDLTVLLAGGGASIFTLTEAIKKKNVKIAIDVATKLVEAGEDPIKIMGLIASNVRLYCSMLSLKARGLSPKDIAAKVGKNPYFIQRLLPEVARAYTEDFLKSFYDLLGQKDVDIKTGKQSSQMALMTTLMQLG